MALAPEVNRLLTQVGPGTPGGTLLRRYWMAVAPEAELRARTKKRVRILGEDLVLFRDGAGRYGLIPAACPHRHASLFYGFVENDEGHVFFHEGLDIALLAVRCDQDDAIDLAPHHDLQFRLLDFDISARTAEDHCVFVLPRYILHSLKS